MMKPKAATEHEDGMLEFLEDIIGSSRYQQPISVLSQRVEELNELRSEKVVSLVCDVYMWLTFSEDWVQQGWLPYDSVEQFIPVIDHTYK